MKRLLTVEEAHEMLREEVENQEGEGIAFLLTQLGEKAVHTFVQGEEWIEVEDRTLPN